MNFSITITGQGQELSEALKSLRTVMDGHQFTDGVVQTTIVPGEQKKEVKSLKNTDAKSDPVNMDQTVAEVQQEEADASTEIIPTIVELRAKAQAVGTTPVAKKAIKALLDKFESKSVSDVPEELRAAFLAELEAL